MSPKIHNPTSSVLPQTAGKFSQTDRTRRLGLTSATALNHALERLAPKLRAILLSNTDPRIARAYRRLAQHLASPLLGKPKPETTPAAPDVTL
jgi:hypothetical protein